MELLAPAGNMEKLKTAVHFGADAIYFSGKKFGLRAFAGNFSDDEIVEALNFLHENGKKGYITINIVAFDSDFEELDEYLKLLVDAKADAVIVSDIGMIDYIRKNAPSLDVHVSTQANVTNSFSAKVFAEKGCKRVVLAREMSLEQIKNMHIALGSSIELEAFVHGAMCISYSGRCLLSNYLSGRNSNRGACVQACRWKYYIREESRQDANEIQEDERGTYILNSKDLNMIQHLKELVEAGVKSLKIEGRMKSSYYVATVVNAYRLALDSTNMHASKQLVEDLRKVSHRNYTTGFYFGADDKECLEDSMPVQNSEFVAVVVGKNEEGVWVEQRNRFMTGDKLEILSPDKNIFNKLLEIPIMKDENGQIIADAKNVQQKVFIETKLPIQIGDYLRRNV